MVASSQPLASEAGLRILQSGGNAADAAVAVAAALGVTEPCSTGIGGDAFGLFYCSKRRQVLCLQGNGRSPAGLTLEAVRAAGVTGNELPTRSPLTVSVPGAAGLWEDAVRCWGSGRKTLAEVLQPAIELAERGFPVSPVTARHWSREAQLLNKQGNAGTLLDSEGKGPKPGQLWKNTDLANTYKQVAELGAKKGFYSGPVADAIVSALQSRGGVMTHEDLLEHTTVELEPISTVYNGHVVWEVPPPTAGVVTLMGLNILEAHRVKSRRRKRPSLNFGKASGPTEWTTEQLHVAIEACRLAFADALAWVADPLVHDDVPVEQMINFERGKQRYQQYFDPDKACRPEPCTTIPAGPPKREHGGDTCQWVVVDGDGNAASFIQSNYMGFGTGIVPEGCGFSLQNRCHGFILDPNHPNTLGPRKRPYHTIMPGMITDTEDNLTVAFGCMGGYMQPQGHIQLVLNMLDLEMDPQAALDAPRFCVDKLDSAVGPRSVLSSQVLLEGGFHPDVQEGLAEKGHKISVVGGFSRSVFGKGQIIMRDVKSGVLCAGSDPRGDGCAMGW
eukprot:GHUV01015128.1.p1 GENE.GHUV01015128.1~~GHUV01015128.1.p1  ORF type:complete len:652 (+),score=151.84 GHUV01015128.1:282-1958(+)